MEKVSVPWKTVKGIWNKQFFAQKDKKFWEDGIMKLPEIRQKVVEQKGKYTLFNKVLGENEKCVFYLKIEGTFWPTQ